jgi:hypothetical protein
VAKLSQKEFEEQGWKEIDQTCFPLFRSYELKDPCRLAGHGASALISWTFPGNGVYKELFGCLCVAWFYEGYPLFFMAFSDPHNPEFESAIDAMYACSQASGQDFLMVSYLDEASHPLYESLKGYTATFECNRDGSEYAYRPEDLLALAGKANANKRHAINMMARLGDLSVRELGMDDLDHNLDICLRVEREWCRGRDCAECSKWVLGKCGQKALEHLLAFFDPQVHRAFALYTGERPIGYIIAEVTQKGVVYMHYGKGVENSALPYLLLQVTKDYFADAALIDYGEDMGNPALRTAKERLGKYELLKNCNCVLKPRKILIR